LLLTIFTKTSGATLDAFFFFAFLAFFLRAFLHLLVVLVGPLLFSDMSVLFDSVGSNVATALGAYTVIGFGTKAGASALRNRLRIPFTFIVRFFPFFVTRP
jgi:hypothetical protein